MSNYKKGFLILALLLGFFTPAFGISTNFESNGISINSEYSAATGVQQKIVSQSGYLSGSNVIYGPTSQSVSVYGVNGGLAYSGFTITGTSAVTNYRFNYGSSPYAYAQEWLTSNNANNIEAASYGVDSEGDSVVVYMLVHGPNNDANLMNFMSGAIADSHFAYAGQDTIQTAGNPGGFASAPSGYVFTMGGGWLTGGDYSYIWQFLPNGNWNGINTEGVTPRDNTGAQKTYNLEQSLATGFPSSFYSNAALRTGARAEDADYGYSNGLTGVSQVAGTIYTPSSTGEFAQNYFVPKAPVFFN